MNLNYLSQYFLKLARNPYKENELDILERNIGKLIHFTDINKIGINYQSENNFGENPQGVYGYKLTQSIFDQIKENQNPFEFRGFDKYIFIFDVKGNVLTEENCNYKALLSKLYHILVDKYKLDDDTQQALQHIINKQKTQKTKISIFFSHLRDINNTLWDFFKNSSFNLMQMLLDLKIDAVEIDEYGLRDNIKYQFILFNPKSLVIIDKIDNPLLKNSINFYSKPNQNIKELINNLAASYGNNDEFQNFSTISNHAKNKGINLLINKIKHDPNIYEKYQKEIGFLAYRMSINDPENYKRLQKVINETSTII